LRHSSRSGNLNLRELQTKKRRNVSNDTSERTTAASR
jgi:hypothetical protein